MSFLFGHFSIFSVSIIVYFCNFFSSFLFIQICKLKHTFFCIYRVSNTKLCVQMPLPLRKMEKETNQFFQKGNGVGGSLHRLN